MYGFKVVTTRQYVWLGGYYHQTVCTEAGRLDLIASVCAPYMFLPGVQAQEEVKASVMAELVELGADARASRGMQPRMVLQELDQFTLANQFSVDGRLVSLAYACLQFRYYITTVAVVVRVYWSGNPHAATLMLQPSCCNYVHVCVYIYCTL